MVEFKVPKDDLIIQRRNKYMAKYKPVIKCNCIDETTKGYIMISLGRARDEYMHKLNDVKDHAQKELIRSQTDNLANIISEIKKISDCK